MNRYIAVDVGGTLIKYALLSKDAEILEKGEVPTPKNQTDYLQALCLIYEKYKDVGEAMVMSAPGRIDAENGYFHTAGALHFMNQTNLRDLLKQHMPIPFSVINDAKSAALAELWKGSMKGIQHGSLITLGTGIGGAMIIDGKLYQGHTFAAGEYSNIAVDLLHPQAENNAWAYAGSVPRLVARYAKEKDLQDQITGKDFFIALANQDEVAKTLFHEFIQLIAMGIYSLQSIIDVQRYAIGGGISQQPIVIESLRQALQTIFDEHPFTPASMPEIVPCTFGNDANLIGALYHYLYEVCA